MLGRSVVKFKFDYSSHFSLAELGCWRVFFGTWVKLNVILPWMFELKYSDIATQVFGYDVSDFQISGLNYLEMVSQIKCFNTLYLKYLLVSIWMLSHQLALPTSSAPSLHVCHLHHRQYDSLMITQSYFKDRWNMFDFITVLGSIVDALMVEFAVRAKKLFPNFKIICLQVLFIQRIAVDFFGLVCILEPYI